MIEMCLLYPFPFYHFPKCTKSFGPLPEQVTRSFTHLDPYRRCSLCLKCCSPLKLMNCKSFFKTQLKCFLFWETVSSPPRVLTPSCPCLSHFGTQQKNKKIQSSPINMSSMLLIYFRDCKLWSMARSGS